MAVRVAVRVAATERRHDLLERQQHEEADRKTHGSEACLVLGVHVRVGTGVGDLDGLGYQLAGRDSEQQTRTDSEQDLRHTRRDTVLCEIQWQQCSEQRRGTRQRDRYNESNCHSSEEAAR